MLNVIDNYINIFLTLEQTSMKEKLVELEKKEMESKESERMQMDILIKREKEL